MSSEQGEVVEEQESDVSAFAISPKSLMDLIFGTYRCPDHEPESFGIQEPVPRGYFAQLLYPMLPRKWGQKLLDREKK